MGRGGGRKKTIGERREGHKGARANRAGWGGKGKRG